MGPSDPGSNGSRIRQERDSGSLLSTLSFQTWRQLWRVLEMSDIVLLITDIRHPVSTGDESTRGWREEDSCGLKGRGRSWETERCVLSFPVSPALC